ncbi:Sterol desaturase/sphingolipid hydroxylase, fatty acid hydroxylase superfamily [Parasphingorhabdus marina DSM 22363]|uniref:Sterol desaturase/sphingolipid hydroxylase, fatty acid hydroxylase superfamily n=1 Tax=Parasphingorhabdus marina DSM 22363 TaxID=1123272 RepID=A0A1N6D6N5_9SPHN|nr:sterol desaturase family protein [Parasphingorhabdus marina]SIN66488.1 Sterol desaturase/sphingolipid hydroxylase, fatty acid hydroxylase superfamily [Parasphingorhabdus marina DSM 22363]
MPDLIDAIVDHMIGAFTFDLGRYLIAAGVLSLLLWIFRKWSDARRIQSRRAGIADYKREFFSSMRTVLVFGLTTISTVLMEAAGWVTITAGEIIWPLFVLQLLAMIVAHDAYFYWMHRWLHTKTMFRFSHLHHHKSRTPTPWSAYSFSSFEAVAEAAFVPVYLLIVSVLAGGMYPFAIFLFLAHMIIRNVMGHSGVELFPAGWTRGPLGWITTTTHHDLHHSQGHSNFGLYFTWWDRWMGTEHPEYEAKFNAVAKPIGWNVKAASQISIIAFALLSVATTARWV